MDFNISDLEKLRDSSDFNFVRDILVKLKESDYKTTDYNKFLKSFQHNRLFMKPLYICDTNLCVSEDNIVNVVIKRTIDKILSAFEDRYSSINEIDLENNCIPISFFVKDVCDSLEIESSIIKIFPGYDMDARLFDGNGFHYSNILNIEGKMYLVDLTYKQFFKKNFSFLEEIGVVGLCAPRCGIFMFMDSKRCGVAEELLKNGFIEIKDNIFKSYCDGFTISFRNGLYYDVYSSNFSTNYTDQDYINFIINRSDSQINHEMVKCLGPLKL